MLRNKSFNHPWSPTRSPGSGATATPQSSAACLPLGRRRSSTLFAVPPPPQSASNTASHPRTLATIRSSLRDVQGGGQDLSAEGCDSSSNGYCAIPATPTANFEIPEPATEKQEPARVHPREVPPTEMPRFGIAPSASHQRHLLSCLQERRNEGTIRQTTL